MTTQPIIVTGSLAYDQILNLPGKFSSYILPDKIHQINVSFATDTHTKSFGGNAGNQAYSLALLNQNPYIVGTVGNDFTPYKRFLTKNSINTKFIRVMKQQLTALGIAITDEQDNQIWGFSKGAMKFAKNLSLKPIVKKLKKEYENVFVIIAPNEPDAMVHYIDECIEMKLDFAFDPAFYVPILSVDVLRKGIKHARMVFGNDYEIALLKKRVGITDKTVFSNLKRQSLEQIIVTTLGEKGSIIQASSNEKIKETINIQPAKLSKMIDPTGAGDAYRSGFLAGFLTGKDMKTCGQMGSIAAAYAIEKYGTMEHSYSPNEFWKRYEKNYG